MVLGLFQVNLDSIRFLIRLIISFLNPEINLTNVISFCRWHVVMPAIVAKSIAILSDAGLGMAMFSLGMLIYIMGKSLCFYVFPFLILLLMYFCRLVYGPST